MPSAPDLCEAFADFAFSARFEDLPPDAVEGAKKSLLDAIGVTLAASGLEPAALNVVGFVEESGGRPEAGVLGFDLRVPAMMAALANGAMAHCLDYDDQTPWGQHAGSSLIPAVLAITERKGGVSGKELITAVAIGQDLFNRLKRHVDWRKDWMFTTVVGVFCAAAASARLLGLPRQKIANALGIASMQSAGIAEVVNATGSDLRALYAGFPAKGAVLAALLADRGVPGVPGLFEAPNGVMATYFGGRYDRDKILAGLGRDFTGGLTLYKRWPAVGTAHSHMHATIGLVQENDIKPADIAGIDVYVGDYHQLMCDPIEARRAPKTLVDAKFSLPYLVAVCAVYRDLNLKHFTLEALADAQVLEVARKITPIPDSSLDWRLELPPGRVAIRTASGARFEKVGLRVPGNPDAPMTWDQILAKFADCAAHARTPLSAARIASLGQIAQNLENETDATLLLR